MTDIKLPELFQYERDHLIELIREEGGKRRDRPVKLSSGGETWVYLDVKGILTTGQKLNLAVNVLRDWIFLLNLGVKTAIGGPTMGADSLSIAMVSMDNGSNLKWFSVRDKAKTTHGLGRWIEGATLGPQDNVVITDDVASSGKSLAEASQRVLETGAKIAAVVPLVDRAGLAKDRLASIGITAYHPVIDYKDLELEPL